MISFPSFLLFLLSSFVSCLPAIPLAPLSLGTDKAIPGGYIITLGPRSLSSSQFTSAVHGDAFNAQWNEKENDHYSWLENILSTKADFTLSSSSAPVKAKVQHKYKVGNYRGYSAVLSDDLIELIRQRPEVRSVEADEVVSIKKKAKSNQVQRIPEIVQRPAPWNLVRLSKDRTSNYTKPPIYVYPKKAGLDIITYVIDTGIYIEHNEFNSGRATWGANFIPNSPNTDENGHGTHVASSICGTKYGVAKKSKVVAVKVLDAEGSGTYSGVMAGIDWAVQNAIGKEKKTIFNLSLGGGRHESLNFLIDSAVTKGIVVVVAAGNSYEDACNASPASAAKAITVGAVDIWNKFASWSNYGPCVDINAPGVDIIGAWIGGVDATYTISGTSMAAPHIAGVVALYKNFYPLKSPQELQTLISAQSKEGIITDLPTNTTPNLYVNIFKLNKK